MEGLDNMIKEKLLFDKKISEESLILWKFAILTKVDKKIQSLTQELNHLYPTLIRNKSP